VRSKLAPVALIALLVLAGVFGASRVAGDMEPPEPPTPPSAPEAPPVEPPPAASPPAEQPAAPRPPRIEWRRSRAVGVPSAGRLVRGVQLPAEGERFFTWDPILRRAPNRGWRRWGTDRLVRVVLRTVEAYARANPSAPRLGIGDLSRPRGGDFGRRYGLPGHASHQNGLDVDVYYPRHDKLERAPRGAADIDRALSQDLVDRFVRAGATRVFVGPNTGLRGPPGVVQRLAHHDNHLHVRLPR
jgi:murein endopeptidase